MTIRRTDHAAQVAFAAVTIISVIWLIIVSYMAIRFIIAYLLSPM